jgi:hypothetical protein
MADPFDALRRRDGVSAQAPPDPAFRSALLAELERALTRDDAHLSPLVTGSEPVPLEVTVSSPISPSAPSGSPNRRFLAIGLAAAAVVALVVTGVLVTRDDDVEPVAAVPVATDSASSDAAGSSSAPTTTAAPTTTVVPTTETPAGDDAERATSILLEESEYADGWFDLSSGVVVSPTRAVQLDAAVAEEVPSCRAYIDVVFEGPRRPAGVAYRWFFHPSPRSMMLQYVVVLPDEAAAIRMFEATEEPAFSACLSDYLATIPNTDCCDVDVVESPLRVDGKVEAPPLTIAGDQASVRSYVSSWTDEQGVSHGPEHWVSATIRVGRSITVIEALVEGEGAIPLVGLDDFEQIAARAAAKAERVLAS